MHHQVHAEKLLCLTVAETAKPFRTRAFPALNDANGMAIGFWLCCYTRREVAAARVMSWLAALVKT